MEDFFKDTVAEEEGIDFARYLKGIIRRWWLVGIAFLGVTVPWVLYLKKQPPVYTVEVIINFEDVGSISENLVESRIQRLQSRTFAEEVTAKLGLTLELVQTVQLPFINRQDVFKVFSTTKEPVVGTYMLRFYPSGTCALYFGSKQLDSLRIERFVEDTVSYNGFNFSLNPNIMKNRTEVDFIVHGFQGTVRSLQSRVNIWTNRPLNNIMGIYLEDKDPILVSQTVNMLADIFVQKSIEMTNENRRVFSNFLKNQLGVVQQELDKTDVQLQVFRNNHLMGLDQETQGTINRLAELNRDSTTAATYREELRFLLEKLDPISVNFDININTLYVYSQISQNPAFDTDSDMKLARQRYEDERQVRGELLRTRNLPETNPDVIESSEKLVIIENEIVQLARNKLTELDRQISQIGNQTKEFQKELETIPEED
ncbi:Wzz/FepE/Etk N-terminal domain-containing protein, partial [bacterium]|nr:Wzz/FepE/Etk N-terminal domain-containing protein [bacterium]